MDILSTLFQQQSRKIGMIVPSVVVSEKHTDTLEITEHPVEVGAAIADHAYKKPSEVVMEVGFAGGGSLLDFASNLTATNLLGLSPQQTYQEILDLQASRIPFDVVTGKRLYSNMLIRAGSDDRQDNRKRPVCRPHPEGGSYLADAADHRRG
jgi:hypothetical protein